MDGRTSTWLLPLFLALGSAGCITTQTEVDVPPPASGKETPKIKKEDGPKTPASAKTEIKLGDLKEGEADSEEGKKNPEYQARMRDDARQAYQQALKMEPNNLDAWRHLGKLYVKTGDFPRALETYKKALAKYPKDAPLWYDLGLCHNRRKDFKEGVHCLGEALKLDPENRTYMKTLGFTLAYRGQIDQGLELLIRVHGSAQAHYYIARVLVQRDQLDQAKEHLQTALRENGRLEPARELLASLENPNSGPVHVASE